MHGLPRIHRRPHHWIGCIQCPHKFASPLSIRSWFKGGAAHCGYSWREKLRQPPPPLLEAVCSPECPEFDSEGCQRALSLLYSDVEPTFLSAHSMTTPVSIDAVPHLPLPPAFLELDVPSPFHQDGEFDADLTFDGVYELDGVSNGFPRWKSTHHTDDDGSRPLGARPFVRAP